MIEIYSLVSVAMIASPVIVGAGAFFAIWFRDEFYKDQLYDYND